MEFAPFSSLEFEFELETEAAEEVAPDEEVESAISSFCRFGNFSSIFDRNFQLDYYEIPMKFCQLLENDTYFLTNFF